MGILFYGWASRFQVDGKGNWGRAESRFVLRRLANVCANVPLKRDEDYRE